MVTHKHSKKLCRAKVSRKIRLLKREGKSQKQSIAIALSIARQEGCSKFIKKLKR